MTTFNTGWPSEGEDSIPEDVLTIAKFLMVERSAEQEADRAKADIYCRLAHALATKTLGELEQAAARNPEAFLSCTERLRESIAYYATQIEVLRAVKACILVALSEGAGVQSGELEHAAHDGE
jgi:hypothetical protein